MTKYDLAARIMLEDMDGFDGRMSAAEQRRIFGAYLFGKQRVTITLDGQGEVGTSRSDCFGTQAAGYYYSLDEVADAVNCGRDLRA